MPTHYTLKRSPIDKNRLLKLCKESVENSIKDRKLALETYKYFKSLVTENPNDNTSKTLMVDCLKAMQASTKTGADLIELFIKVENTLSEGKTKDSISLFDQLETSSGD